MYSYVEDLKYEIQNRWSVKSPSKMAHSCLLVSSDDHDTTSEVLGSALQSPQQQKRNHSIAIEVTSKCGLCSRLNHTFHTNQTKKKFLSQAEPKESERQTEGKRILTSF
jgi:hypothetical protein